MNRCCKIFRGEELDGPFVKVKPSGRARLLECPESWNESLLIWFKLACLDHKQQILMEMMGTGPHFWWSLDLNFFLGFRGELTLLFLLKSGCVEKSGTEYLHFLLNWLCFFWQSLESFSSDIRHLINQKVSAAFL
jgi:hypothetical protein